MKKQGFGPWPLLVVLFLVFSLVAGCSTPGTGARTDPQTGTTTVGAQQVGRVQAGATYLIKSEGTVYNIDTDGAPRSEAAVEAIAAAIVAYDETIASLNVMLKDPGLDPDAKATVLETLKWITEEKRLYMAEAKGAFGVVIEIKSVGNGHGSSTVDTAGATGEVGVPPTNEPENK